MWLNFPVLNVSSTRFVHMTTLVIIAVLVSLFQPLSSLGQTSSDVPLLSEIIIEGNERTNRSLILHEMDLEIGQPFSKQDMDRVWDLLEDIGYFAFVDMEYDDSAGDSVALHVFLEEDMFTAYGPSILHSRRFKYEIGAWIEENNLGGRGETLRLEAYAYRRLRGRLTWTKPWLFGVKGLESAVALGAEKANFVFRPTDYTKGDADLQVRQHLTAGFFALVGVNRGSFCQKDDYSWQQPYRGPGSSTTPEFYGEHCYGNTAWRATIGIDTRSNPYYPSKGIFGQATVKHWTSPSYESYTETSFDARAFIPGKWGHIFALRAWGQQTDNATPLDNVLFFGGPGTIRGHRFASLEGEEGYLLTAEYRIPLFIMPISPNGELVGAGIHLFFDAGDAWFNGADPGRALQSFGAGFHLNLDKQQFRFEAANTMDGQWQFEFLDHFNF